MIDEGEKVIREKGFNVIHLAEALKKSGKDVIKALEDQREVINDNKKIQEVATLSAKDAEIGGLIAEVMGKIGKEGVVTVEDSNTIGNSFDIVEGMQFDRGYVSQYMVSNQDRMEAVLDDPYISSNRQKDLFDPGPSSALARKDHTKRQEGISDHCVKTWKARRLRHSW
jgi:chaperonin GroEL